MPICSMAGPPAPQKCSVKFQTIQQKTPPQQQQQQQQKLKTTQQEKEAHQARDEENDNVCVSGEPASLVLTAFDAEGVRIRDGRARVSVVGHWEKKLRVADDEDEDANEGHDKEEEKEAMDEEMINEKRDARSAHVRLQNVVVHDNDDGTYTASFLAPEPGIYRIHVEINGRPVAGSPFEACFIKYVPPPPPPPPPPVAPPPISGARVTHPPLVPAAAAAAAAAAVATNGLATAAMAFMPANVHGSLPSHQPPLRPPQQPLVPMTAASAVAAAVASASLLMAARESDADIDMYLEHRVLEQSILVTNLSHFVSDTHLRALLRCCGEVKDVRRVDRVRNFSLVEFHDAAACTEALKMDGMMLGDKSIQVEMATRNASYVHLGGIVPGTPPPPPPPAIVGPVIESQINQQMMRIVKSRGIKYTTTTTKAASGEATPHSDTAATMHASVATAAATATAAALAVSQRLGVDADATTTASKEEEQKEEDNALNREGENDTTMAAAATGTSVDATTTQTQAEAAAAAGEGCVAAEKRRGRPSRFDRCRFEKGEDETGNNAGDMTRERSRSREREEVQNEAH